MSIIYKKGDVLKALKNGEVDIVAHGVNCSGGFGSGIAGQIAKQFHEVKKEYIHKYQTEGWGLGQTQTVNYYTEGKGYRHKCITVNCATQKYYGSNPRSQPNGMYCDYEAIKECMIELHNSCKVLGLILGINRIGCGLGGGDWNEVEKIINDIFSDITIVVYDLE